MLKDKRAFTLIELIVTIAVLGILVLIGGPRLLNYTQKAELTRIQHDVRVMENKMSEIINQDNNYNEWDDNQKDLGTLVLKNQLYEKEGIASFVDRSYLRRNVASSENKVKLAQNENELGVGGDLHELSEESTGYKVIPESYEKEIGTRLDGTFYSNRNGKVYYEPNKPLTSIKNENLLACLAAEDLDYEFSVINGKGTITGYNGTLTHLYIPSAFLVDDECVTVQVIGRGAFRNGTFTRVHIPESVKEIEENAFQGGQLIEVDIPHSVDYIGSNAFADNPLRDNGVTINSSESSVNIDSSAFSGSTSGSSIIYRTPTADKLKITVQTKVNSEGRRTGTITGYYGDSYRGSQSTGSSNVGSGSSGNTHSSGNFNNVISIPSTIIVNGETVEITEVAKGAYQGRGIIHVEFPETLERIEDYAFAGNQLINLEIPNSVGHIGNYAFAYNEINKELTMEYVKILDTNHKQDINNKTGNIEKNSVPVDELGGQVKLLSHIFILSGTGHEIAEDYNPSPSEPLYKFTEMTFSPAGASGRMGPTQAQVDNAYKNSELAGLIKVENGIQLWTVPKTGTYEIVASGAKGGDSNRGAGLGVSIKGDFELKKGQVLKIIVGQKGTFVDRTGNAGSSGGGSFVWLNSSDKPLIVAGGGSGAMYGIPGINASFGTSGNKQTNTSFSGEDGKAGSNQYAGGGWLTSGRNGGFSILNNGGLGGLGGEGRADGGFGGGGPSYGGGGGYSGGAGYHWVHQVGNYAGTGGGSFNSGENKRNIGLNRDADGSVKIKVLD